MFSRFFLHRNISSHLGPDFKIILLQRDPRATINSLRTEPQEWLSGAAAPTKICGNLLQDFTAMQEVCIYLLINCTCSSRFDSCGSSKKIFFS